MKDQAVEECGIQPQVITSSFCTDTFGVNSAMNLNISPNGFNQSSFVTPIVNSQRVFSLSGNYSEIPLTSLNTTPLATSYNATSCGCSNFLLEAHYTIYFNPMSSQSSNLYYINNVTVDLVYGTYKPKSC